MNRRIFLISLLTGLSATGFAAAENRLTADVLKSKLAAKTAEENLYCETVVRQRDTGVLPEKVLTSVYTKAVSKERSKRFIYFQNAMDIVCKKLKIRL
jgi:hypothetical protein